MIAKPIPDVHAGCFGQTVQRRVAAVLRGHDERVLQMKTGNQILLQGHPAFVVLPELKADDAVLPGSIQQLDNAHPVNPHQIGDLLLGFSFEVIVPRCLDHEHIFIDHGNHPFAFKMRIDR